MEKFNLEQMIDEIEEEEKAYQIKKKNLSQEDINKVFSQVRKDNPREKIEGEEKAYQVKKTKPSQGDINKVFSKVKKDTPRSDQGIEQKS